MSPKINIIFNLFLPVVGHFSWICSVNLENVPTLRKRGIQLAVFEKLLAFGGSAKNLWDTLKILNSWWIPKPIKPNISSLFLNFLNILFKTRVAD